MKKSNAKKGFTLVELVIVIAVIAILAGVMIATFSNVVSDAQASAAMQEAKSKIDAAYVECLSGGDSANYITLTFDSSDDDKTLTAVAFTEEDPTKVDGFTNKANVNIYKVADITDSVKIKVTANLWILWSADGYSIATEDPGESITAAEPVIAISGGEGSSSESGMESSAN